MSSSRHDIGCTEDRAKRASPFIRDFVSKYWTTYTVRSVRRRRRRQVSICSCWRSKRLCWLFPGCFEIFEFAPLRRPSHTTPQVRPSLSRISRANLKSSEIRALIAWEDQETGAQMSVAWSHVGKQSLKLVARRPHATPVYGPLDREVFRSSYEYELVE